MMGPKAKAALPALEKRFHDQNEDIQVRVAAARAMARIKGTDEVSLYKQLPDLERSIVKSTHEKSTAWRRTYLKREGSKNSDDLQGWASPAWLVAAMTSGENLDKANEALSELLKDRIETKSDFGSADTDYIWIFMTCYSKASKYRGRLSAENEAAFKELWFMLLNEP